MPLAVFYQVTGGFWPLGRITCDLWHAIDVCSCTASILNLSCIAFERYVATADPLRYSVRLNRKTVWMLVGAVWLCSILISFPAIIWWRYYDIMKFRAEMPEINQTLESNSNFIVTVLTADELNSAQICEFPDDPWYLLSSSFVSFYIPCGVMIFLYFKIYRTATRVKKSLESGNGEIVTEQIGKSNAEKFFNKTVQNEFDSRKVSKTASVNISGQPRPRSSMILRVHRGRQFQKFSFPNVSNNSKSNINVSLQLSNETNCQHISEHNLLRCALSSERVNRKDNFPSNRLGYSVSKKEDQPGSRVECQRLKRLRPLKPPSLLSLSSIHETQMCTIQESRFEFGGSVKSCTETPNSPSTPLAEKLECEKDSSNRMRRRRAKLSQWGTPVLQRVTGVMERIQRLSREQKAAKTLGIIILAFVSSWLPFFLCTLLAAFQKLNTLPRILSSDQEKVFCL